MKKLSLYIDKWYIVGALSTDGITRLLRLPNREDRIWLYFHEDVANNDISYSKEFQRNYRDNENHYYGDVFSQITTSSAKYIMFKRQQDMIGIFQSANIFDDIRRDIEEDNEVETYVSFSKDISLAARKLFLDVLAEEKFVVKESVARIEHLALEYAAKKSSISRDGYYLVLNACNENLHYSIYQKSEDLFVRTYESTLNGLGTDVRSRALIEQIVDNINSREHLLKTQEEQEREYLRMTQYVDNWIVKLSTARSAMPVQISGITFSVDPHRDYSISVQRSKIDQRTGRIVEDIVRAITTFVKNSNVSHEQVQGIVFLGNTFSNQQFKNEFQKYYNLNGGGMLSYLDTDLSSLVNAYTWIDCEQFSAETSKLRSSAEAELQRQRNAEEEEAARKKAAEEANALESKRLAETEAERKYNEAMQRGYDSESDHDYDAMEEYFNIALSYRPNDEEASNKYNEALRKKAELSVRTNNYKERINQAKAAFDNGDWETAKQKSEEALSFMNDSKEALRIKDESTRRIKQGKDFERYLDRADLFIAQKVYDEALKELEKAKLLDVTSEETTQIKERELRIANEKGAIEKTIRELSENLNQALSEKRFEEAIICCNQLVEVDFTNSRKWSAKMGDIKTRQEEQKKAESLLKSLLVSIDSAQWNEDWTKLADLCRQALDIREDENLREKLLRAERKISEKESLKQMDDSIREIKDLILEGEFSHAKQMLAKLEKTSLNSEYQAKVRELRTLIFKKEEEAETAKLVKTRVGFFEDSHESKSETTQKPKRPIGFVQQPQQPKGHGFFDEPTTKKTQSQPIKKAPQKKDDFFDKVDLKRNNSNNNTIKVGGLTNDDFNF